MMRLPNFSRKEALVFARHFSSLTHRIRRAGLVNNTLGHELLTSFDNARTHRQQHQLVAVDDHQHREAMRLFVESLLGAANAFSQHTARVSIAPLPDQIAVKYQELTEETNETIDESEAIPTQKLQQSPDMASRNQSEKRQNSGNRNNEVAFKRAIKQGNVERSTRLFEEAQKQKYELSHPALASYFYMIVQTDPISAYSILKTYNEHPDRNGVNMNMYRKLCDTVSTLDPQKVRHRDIHTFVGELLEDLDGMDKKAKETLYPKMVAALATQRSVSLGHYAGKVYQQMIDSEYEMTPGWLRKLLALSKYNRQQDLPFHDIFARLAALDARPHPFSSIAAIHNMFPYTNAKQMCATLEALFDFQQQMLNEEDDLGREKILIDIDCLESISNGAAHAGSPEVMLRLWDIIEQCQYHPTETIYENTVIAYAATDDFLPAFGAMVAMKEDGHEVSRSLLRSFSLAVRSKRQLIHQNFEKLLSSDDLLSLETLNAVMSCYAERGDVREAAYVLDTIRSLDLKPDANTYSFAIEVLGKDIHRRNKTDLPGMLSKNLEQADTVLTMMEEDGIPPTVDVVRNYIELLCIAGEINTATSVVKDCLSSAPTTVNSKTLYRVAVANAESGNFAIAKELASRVTDNIPILLRKIRSKQQRFQHLKSVSKREGELAEEP